MLEPAAFALATGSPVFTNVPYPPPISTPCDFLRVSGGRPPKTGSTNLQADSLPSCAQHVAGRRPRSRGRDPGLRIDRLFDRAPVARGRLLHAVAPHGVLIPREARAR